MKLTNRVRAAMKNMTPEQILAVFGGSLYEEYVEELICEFVTQTRHKINLLVLKEEKDLPKDRKPQK